MSAMGQEGAESTASPRYVFAAVLAELEYTLAPSRVKAVMAAAVTKAQAPDKPTSAPETAIPNNNGETEVLPGGTAVTHRFVQGPSDYESVRWQFVEAGPRHGTPVVFLHGIPDSWHLFHHQIHDLAGDYRVLSIDLKGYGQFDKGPGDYRHAGVPTATTDSWCSGSTSAGESE